MENSEQLARSQYIRNETNERGKMAARNLSGGRQHPAAILNIRAHEFACS